ncbi:MAG TPA: histidine--tRNA ligase [Candidatus Saccharimonadales bacterium]|nr:histidine--tRNA ligase [Candidatus Saccharimonadales bacterium]
MSRSKSSRLRLPDKNATITPMSSLSSQPYKGTRDSYPEDMRVRNYIFAQWRRTVKSFGYEEYGTPLLEPLELYAAKSGQELVSEQTYTFTDRGGRVVAIRPELTPSVSRMVAARRQEMAYPARLYNISNYMRYERPQRGREREFWQMNVDIFGVEGALPESEVIGIGYTLLKNLGATDEMFIIKINNRKVINYMMAQYLGLDTIQAQLMIKLFDRKNKIAAEDFRDQAIEIFGEQAAPEGLKKISALLSAKSMGELPEDIRESGAVKEVQELFTLLERAGVKNAIFDITLMRGLDYYTGTVFEFFDTHPDNNRAMYGGGRYDGLVGLFGAEPISAVGMAPGLTMTELFLQTHKLLPDLPSTTEVYIVVLGDALKGAMKLASDLREEGVNTELDITGRKLDKQLKTAVKKHIPFIIFVGDDELQSEIYPFKDTASSEEQKLSFERIVSSVKDRRRKHDDDLDDLFE